MSNQYESMTLGDIFKHRRKEMNISLKEVENATSIRMSYLQSIEDNEMTKLISPVYAQGFVKQYAGYLGLDGEKLLKDHTGTFARAESQEFSYGIGTLEIRGNPGAGVKWFPNAMWIVASVGVMLVAWYVARYLNVI